jgi:hypothetical protein
MRLVQSCINSVGYPQTITEFRQAFEWRLEESGSIHKSLNTDEFYRGFDDASGQLYPMKNDAFDQWTSPRWFTQGDVSFFYHTKSALRNALKIRSILSNCLRSEKTNRISLSPGVGKVSRSHVEKLIQVADRGVFFAQTYSGKIFAAARASRNFITRRPNKDLHWRSNNYCDYTNMYLLRNPISIDSLKPGIVIGQSTITPLTRNGFEKIQDAVFFMNKEVRWLKNLRHRDSRITEEAKKLGWKGVALEFAPVFIFENQVREYLITPFLKDVFPRWRICEEVRTSEKANRYGILDYLITRGKIAVPVEAKCVITDGPGLREQLRKYCSVKIALGDSAFKTSGFCLLLDHEKIQFYIPEQPSLRLPEQLIHLEYYEKLAKSHTRLVNFKSTLEDLVSKNT